MLAALSVVMTPSCPDTFHSSVTLWVSDRS